MATHTAYLPLLAKPALPEQLTVGVAGNPNAGKTTLFNALTGLRQKVANYPGVTVERKEGLWVVDPSHPAVRVIDLPGLYSLEATSIDEQIARDILLGVDPKTKRPDVVIVAVDATNLLRNLYLLTQLLETGCRVIVALTMCDLARRSQLTINISKLQTALCVPVIPVVARTHEGIKALSKAVIDSFNALSVSSQQLDNTYKGFNSTFETNSIERPEIWQTQVIERYQWIEQLVNDVVEFKSSERRRITERIDCIATHKVAGPLILLFVMLLVFQTIFSWADLPMTLIDRAFDSLATATRSALPPGIFTDLIASGIIPGVGGVLTFLPQIILLFFFITVLEDSGYMARAAFLMDRLMRSVGLHGKAFVPLLSSFACAVPGIMATRTIESPKDRVATMMIAPFMSCSARLPLYTLLIAAFFSGQRVAGVISLGALIILAMYLFGISMAVGVAWILKHTILKAPSPPFVLELPPYRLPDPANVIHSLVERVGVFLKRAGTVILAISILLWFLAAFPRSNSTQTDLSQAESESNQIANSYAGRAGRLIEPIIKPLGFDWKIGIGLISSFAARETMISTLGIVYNIEDQGGQSSTSLVQAMRNAKHPDGTRIWTPLVSVSLMVFFVLACQCMSTVAVVRRETNSWRWPLFMISYMLVLAYGASLVTYQGGQLLGFS